MKFIVDTGSLSFLEADNRFIYSNINDNLPKLLPDIFLCHQGDALVTLARSESDRSRFVGNIKCHCGKHLGILKGQFDFSEMEFKPAN